MVTVEVQGEDFLAYVDGDLLISVRDKTHTKGSVGLWAGEWATFDDFTVELQ